MESNGPPKIMLEESKDRNQIIEVEDGRSSDGNPSY